MKHSECPICRGNPERTDSPEPYYFQPKVRGAHAPAGADGLAQEMRCTDCGARWHNLYRYVGPVNVEARQPA